MSDNTPENPSNPAVPPHSGEPAQPVQPSAYPPPAYGTPPQPQYAAPQAPPYGTPQPPQYGAPQAQPYGAPQPPQYGAPQSPYGSAPQYPQSPYGAAQPYGAYAAVPKTNVLAVLSMIASIVGALWILPFIGSLAGVIMGHISLKQLSTSGEKGRGMALAGVIVGWIGLALTVLGVIALISFLTFAAVQGERYDI